MSRFFLSLFIITVSFNALAYDVIRCGNVDISIRDGGKIDVDYSYNLGDAHNGRTRNYTFDSKGMLMVFVGTRDSEFLSRSTGSGEIYHFPRIPTAPKIISDCKTSPEIVEILTPAGVKAKFSTITGEILEWDGMKAKVRPLLTENTPNYSADPDLMSNGVSFESNTGILLDMGFKRGGMPRELKDRLSSFRDAKGSICKVKNSEFITVIKTEPIFTLATDSELKDFLKSRCPKLDLSSLTAETTSELPTLTGSIDEVMSMNEMAKDLTVLSVDSPTARPACLSTIEPRATSFSTAKVSFMSGLTKNLLQKKIKLATSGKSIVPSFSNITFGQAFKKARSQGALLFKYNQQIYPALTSSELAKLA